MYKQISVLQDGPLRSSGRVREVIRAVAASVRFNRTRVAVAYASLPGCVDLDTILSKANSAWKLAEKRWLISIDYGHTDPRAIQFLRRLKNSEVRVFDGINLLRRRLAPISSFHPKTFVFDRSGRTGVGRLGFVVGSANLTAGGLDSNVEHVVGMSLSAPIGKDERRLFAPVAKFDEWWDLAWLTADRATPKFIKNYQALRQRHHPRVRDRQAPAQSRKLPASLKQMRAFARWENADCFWIETGNLYKNRGKHAPGNQLDARRGTRVYFGFPYRDVPRNKKLGVVKLKFGSKPAQADRSVWFGNNSMDKIHLPVPGTYGPPEYDNSVVHFKRVRPGEYLVSLGTSRSAGRWRRKSESQGLLDRLGRGRRFGFYS